MDITANNTTTFATATAARIFTISTQFGIGRVCGACDWLLAHYEY